MSADIPAVGMFVAVFVLLGLVMHHYHNDGNKDWEFQWVEDSLNYTGHVFVEGLKGLTCVLGSLAAAALAAAKEKPKK